MPVHDRLLLGWLEVSTGLTCRGCTPLSRGRQCGNGPVLVVISYGRGLENNYQPCTDGQIDGQYRSQTLAQRDWHRHRETRDRVRLRLFTSTRLTITIILWLFCLRYSVVIGLRDELLGYQ